jgi:hypothetical protein
VDVKQTNILQEVLFDVYEPYEPDAEKPEVDDYTPETYDAMISAKVIIPKGDILVPAKVLSANVTLKVTLLASHMPIPILIPGFSVSRWTY